MWDDQFKPDARSKGQVLFDKGKVSSPRPSDTEIQMFVRDSSGFRVILKTDSFDSPVVFANCTCTQGRKGLFCKHIWACLLSVAEDSPDFLESKTELRNDSTNLKETFVKNTVSEEQKKSQEAQKLKQSEYRKQQYQKKKAWIKGKKNQKKERSPAVSVFPPPVEEALKYFSDNGFFLSESVTKESVAVAKKQLARVFHPDRGGSHEEILELNHFAAILENYIKS